MRGGLPASVSIPPICGGRLDAALDKSATHARRERGTDETFHGIASCGDLLRFDHFTFAGGLSMYNCFAAVEIDSNLLTSPLVD